MVMRLRQTMSRLELAHKLRVDPTTVWRWEQDPEREAHGRIKKELRRLFRRARA